MPNALFKKQTYINALILHGFVSKIGRIIPADIMQLMMKFLGNKILTKFEAYRHDFKLMSNTMDGVCILSPNYKGFIFVSRNYEFYMSKMCRYAFSIRKLDRSRVNGSIYQYESEFSEFKNDEIAFISKGALNLHCLMYTKNGNLYKISQKESDFVEMDMTHIKSRIIQLECGSDHTLLLTELGDVYGEGSNGSYQLSNEWNDPYTGSLIKKISSLSNITQIGCGYKTSFVLNNKGIMFTFGGNKYGILGSNSNLNYDAKIKQVNPYNIVFESFDVLLYHIGCLTTNGSLYFWGYNKYSQCGIKNKNDIKKPNPMHKQYQLKGYMDVRCGSTHSIIKNRDNEYYSFGKNIQEQLLLDKNKHKSTVYVDTPTLIDMDYLMDKMDCIGKIIDLIPGYDSTMIVIQPY